MGAISLVDVINFALDLVQEEPIDSISDPQTATEQLAVRHIDQRRRSVLRKHPWNFATKRELLPPLAEDPPFGDWDQHYTLPADYIRFCTIGEFDQSNKGYQIEENRILVRNTDAILVEGALPIRYIFDFTDIPKFDPLALNLVSIEMAIWITYKVTGKSSLRADLREMLREEAPEAYSIDGQDRPPIIIDRKQVLVNRRGGFGSVRADRADFSGT